MEDVTLSSSESMYRSLYFTPPTNVPPISFNIVGNILNVSSVPWSLSISFEFKQWGVVSCVFESAWYCRDALRIGLHWWDVLILNYIDVWFQNVNILHVCAYYYLQHHFHHHSNHHLCNKKTDKEEINQCPWRYIPFWNIILEFFNLGFGMLIFHVTYLNCLYMSKMSMTLLLPMGDLVCLQLVLFGFLFLVVIKIGSLACFMCFSNVDLSCIFWSISNPFFQNTVSSLLMCFSSSLLNIFQ